MNPTPDWIQPARLDPIGGWLENLRSSQKAFLEDLQSSIQPPIESNRADFNKSGGKSSNPPVHWRRRMEMQVSNGVLHRVLNGEVHEAILKSGASWILDKMQTKGC